MTDATRAALDRSRLVGSAGSAERADALLAQYCAFTEDDLATLREAAGRHDSEALATAAHRMLGAARFVGADAVADAARRLAQAVRTTGDWTPELIADLEHACAAVRAIAER